ncbi:nicotinamide-nucleotide amidohydrolase family protein [Halorubrum sp. JWXQ-INN 858]|uniref:CinA family protein n=1 Tax=Halorubrum sp. JWXQ-INN 858 TaxID=2690782 RepID=UPI001357C1C3|nr:CinA family protein [Halorubrum sp. JWXQ-INN 858]MWV63893.1 nicotinamide-nucleotide amidohydrolase family protein [Halorubrum sp. JWXQ-INN 858]
MAGHDADDPPEVAVGEALAKRGETLATAESLTGGRIGSRITDVPGASRYFDRGFVTYAYDAKRAELGVDRETLDAHGAVSAPVARRMAAGARDRADTTWGVSATGIAGPGGGDRDKPVGLVYVGVAYAAPWGSEESFTRSERYLLDGDRDAVKAGSVDRALTELLASIRTVSEASGTER